MMFDLVNQGLAQIEELVRHLARERAMARQDLHAPAQAPVPTFSDAGAGPYVNADHVAEALAEARALVAAGILEPPFGDPAKIDELIRGPDGLSWTWQKPYRVNGDYAWCGAAAARAWRKVRKEIRQKIFPSLWRLHNAWHGTIRDVSSSPTLIRAGDIVTVGPRSGEDYGEHIVIAQDAPSGLILRTIEGNAKDPINTRREGVIARTRPLTVSTADTHTYFVRRVYRLLEADLA